MSLPYSAADSPQSYKQLDDDPITKPPTQQRYRINGSYELPDLSPTSPSSPSATSSSPSTFLTSILHYFNPRSTSVYRDRSFAARRARLIQVLRATLSEVLATSFLIYLTCAASLVCHFRGIEPGPTVLINALTAGLTVSFCIYGFYPLSGAHMNPFITLSLLITSHISPRRAVLYWMAQLAGGNLAMALLYPTFQSTTSIYSLISLQPVPLSPSSPTHSPLYTSDASLLSCFAMEGIGLFILVLTNFKAAVDRMEEDEDEEAETTDGGWREVAEVEAEDGQEGVVFTLSNRARSLRAGAKAADVTGSRLPVVPIALAIGCTVGVLVLVGQGSSGGGYNPVRYLSSAMWSGVWVGWWCWLGGETVGMLAACLVHVALQQLGLRATYWRERARDRLRRRQKQQQRSPQAVDAEEEHKSEV